MVSLKDHNFRLRYRSSNVLASWNHGLSQENQHLPIKNQVSVAHSLVYYRMDLLSGKIVDCAFTFWFCYRHMCPINDSSNVDEVSFIRERLDAFLDVGHTPRKLCIHISKRYYGFQIYFYELDHSRFVDAIDFPNKAYELPVDSQLRTMATRFSTGTG